MNRKEIILCTIVGISIMKILHNQKTIDEHLYRIQNIDIYGNRVEKDELIENNTIGSKLNDFIYKLDHFIYKLINEES